MPTAQQIDVMLPFLDRFTVEGFSPGAWRSPPGQLPWFDYNEAVLEFRQALYDNGWIVRSLNWGDWQDTACEYLEKPEKIESADAQVIQKLLTTHVRKDRFCEGHLVAVFENGHVVALLRRLKTIRNT